MPQSTMTVGELRELLTACDDDDEVFIRHDTGNYWHMIRADGISEVSEAYAKHSEYLNGLQVLGDENQIDEADPKIRKVVLIG